MSLTEEQIAKMMQKEIKSKSLLVNFEDLETVKEQHLKDGWELVNVVPINNRFKVTFRIVK